VRLAGRLPRESSKAVGISMDLAPRFLRVRAQRRAGGSSTASPDAAWSGQQPPSSGRFAGAVDRVDASSTPFATGK